MSADHHGKQAAAVVGPWGGEGGYHWDDGVHNTVRMVEISHGAGVDSIKVEYEVNGRSVWSQIHGGNGGTKRDKIRLEHPNEYLTSVHGYYGRLQERGPVIVRSLSFQTNTTTYGPYGVEDGTYFTFPKSHGKIVGFIGKSGRFLDCIGAYVEPLHAPISHSNHYGTPKTWETTSQAPISSNHISHPHQNGTPKPREAASYAPISSDHISLPHQNGKPKTRETTSHAPMSSDHIFHPHHNGTPKTRETTSHAPISSDHISHPHQNGTPKTWETTSHAPISSNHISHPHQNGTPKNWETTSHAPVSSNHISHPHENGTPKTWETTSHAPVSSNHISHPHQNGMPKTLETTSHSPISSNHISHPHKNETPKIWETTSHAPISSNPISHPHQYVTPKTWETASYGAHKYEYSMIQGNIGANYDLIVAFKRKDGHDTPPVNPSPKIPHDLSRSPKIHEMGSDDRPKSIEKKIEKVGSKNGQLGVVTSGPWGGNGGSLFDDGVYDGIRHVTISRNVCIVSIRACYDQNRQPVWGSKNGGTGSFKYDQIVFNYPSEMLTHITGYYGPAMKMGPNVIKSMTFHTTHGKHGPYGEEQGEFFTTQLKEGSVIVGFHGRKGLFLDAIGVHVLEGKLKPPFNNISHGSSKPNNQLALIPKKPDNPYKVGKRGQGDEVVHRMVKDPAPYGPGPWGGEGGKPWDDGVFTGIKQIILTITDAICCMEIEYDRNGQSVWSVKHGAPTGGQTANRVKLDYPNEVLTCISGYHGPIKKEQGTQVIQSLTFHTSRKKYGPFGEELGTYFVSGTTEGKVVGFHGRSSVYLDAIGVHMQHWLGNKKPSKPLMKMFA